MSELNGAASPSDESKTAFSVLRVQFPLSPDRLRTLDFLEAAHGLVTIVEKFGKVFAPVINDMNGNIKKLRNKYQEDSDSHVHLEGMILREQVEGGIVATDALLWLRRALHFLSRFFECIIMDSDSERAAQDLAPMVKQAYSETLEPYHGWLGTQLFNVMSRFAPNRADLFYTLALDRNHREEQVLRDLRHYHQRMAACVLRLTQFYSAHRLEDAV